VSIIATPIYLKLVRGGYLAVGYIILRLKSNNIKTSFVPSFLLCFFVASLIAFQGQCGMFISRFE